MAVNHDGLKRLEQAFKNLSDGEVQEFMEETIVGEGVFAVGEARKIANDEKGLSNTGHYGSNFHAGNKALSFNGTNPHDGSRPKRSGLWYRIDFYNNLDYAKPLEYGFRSHFVPGEWQGKTFVYIKGAKGGMYVGPRGGFVRGHFTLRRAVRRTKDTQNARLVLKLDRYLKNKLK